MRISQAAARSGLSIDTIRYYEKSGLMPEIPRGPDGRRRFSAEIIEWLILLQSLRVTGMPMKQMRRFAALYRAGDDTLLAREQILLTHSEQLAQRQADLDHCKDILTRKLAIYRERLR